MGIRVRRRILKRALVLLIVGIVCYYLVNGFLAAHDYNSSAIGPLPEEHIKTQRLLPALKLDQKKEIVPVRLSIVKQMSALRGQGALQNYCNSPSEKTTGHEGAQLEGFKLRLVHVFTRHGDRTSIHRVPGYKPNTYNCKFSTWYTGSNEKFRSFPQRMDEMSKSQSRNYFRKLPAYPNADICSDSVLTSRGALQHLQLGTHLYDSYIKHFHVLKSHKSLSSQLNIKSTVTSRTYQSTVAFLYGFVPEFNISDFEIGYSKDLYFCSKENSARETCSCSRTRVLQQGSLWFQGTIIRNSSHYNKLCKAISGVFSIDDNDIRWLTRVADALVPTYCHNFSIPCSTYNSSKCVNHDLLGSIWNAIIDKEFSNWDDPDLNFLKYCSIKMAPVLNEVQQRMKDLTEGRDTRTFNLYSGHDVTVSPLLYILGLHDGRWPPYASRVVMEMYEEENEDQIDRFYLRFLYNGVDKTESVIFCRNRTVNGLCNFKLFSEFVSKTLLQRFGYSNYKDTCIPETEVD